MKIKLELFGASKDFSNENIIEFNLKEKWRSVLLIRAYEKHICVNTKMQLDSTECLSG